MRACHECHARPWFHRLLYDLALLRYRTPPAHATSRAFCLLHECIVRLQLEKRQMGTSNAYFSFTPNGVLHREVHWTRSFRWERPRYVSSSYCRDTFWPWCICAKASLFRVIDYERRHSFLQKHCGMSYEAECPEIFAGHHSTSSESCTAVESSEVVSRYWCRVSRRRQRSLPEKNAPVQRRRASPCSTP
jgi:glycogen debranching enzyme